MPLQKVLLKPGVNRENTRYTTEGGWYECNNVRFRQGNPEIIGGWTPFSLNTFVGVCRSLWNWATLGSVNLIGVGTNLKFYIEEGGFFNDVTPIRATTTLGANPFTGDGTTTVVVTAASHGAVNGDYVTFSGVTGTYASLLNAQYQITYINANSYSITTASAVAAGATGGAAVVAAYQLNTGPAYTIPLSGWGAGSWGAGTWGVGGTSNTGIRLWSQMNYGQDLIFGPRGGGIYYWNATSGVTVRGVNLNTLGGTVTFTVASPTVATFTTLLTEGTAVQFSVSTGGTLPTGISSATTYYLINVNGVTANLIDTSGNLINVSGAGSGTFSVSLLVDVPTVQNVISISDTSRFVFAMGCNDYGSAVQDPMLIRWSDQENPYVWTPDATNQAGSIRLSHGTEIVAAVQTRQEIVVFTDATVYSLQYLGPPVVWSSQILGDNISIAGQNAAVIASGVVYWMGQSQFFSLSGSGVAPIFCPVWDVIFQDLDLTNLDKIRVAPNSRFGEITWYYPVTNNGGEVTNYVKYNVNLQVWDYGTLARTAWINESVLGPPIGADPSSLYIYQHETSPDADGQPMLSSFTTGYFALSEADVKTFIDQVWPDMKWGYYGGVQNATVNITFNYVDYPSQYSSPQVAGPYALTSTTQFISPRIRGRLVQMNVNSSDIGSWWRIGNIRYRLQQDGKF